MGACSSLTSALLVAILISSGCSTFGGMRQPEEPLTEDKRSACTLLTEEGGHITLVLKQLDWPGWRDACTSMLPFLRPGPPPYDGRRAVTLETLLEETGYFELAICEVVEGGEGLACQLTPQRVVREIEIHGRLPVGVFQEELGRRLLIAPGDPIVDEERLLETQRERLILFLERDGFFESSATLQTIPIGGAEPNLGVLLEIHLEVGRSARLREVVVEGEHPLDEGRVESRLRRFGFLWFFPQRFRPDRFQRDLDDLTLELQEEGWPDARVSGRWRLDPDEDFVDAAVRIEPGPRLLLRFIGNRALRDSELEKLSTFAGAGIIDETEMQRTAKSIERAYQEAGYPNVRIETESEQPDPKTLEISFLIAEGRRAQIRRVRFEGNEIVSDRTLRRRAEIRTRRSRFIWRGHWVDADIEADVAAIEELYEQRGYGAATVSAERVDWSDHEIEVVFRIDEGSKREVKALTVVDLPEEIDDEELMKRLELRASEPFIEGRWERDRNEILTTLASKGYPMAQVSTIVDAPAAETGGDVTIEHFVLAGTRVVVGGLLVRGNFRTRASLIKEQLRLEEGEPLDLVSLGEARRRLRGLGAFYAVDIEPLGLWLDEPESWLVVTVRERPARSADLVAGYATDEGFSIGGDYRDRNVLGRAIHLDLRLRLGDVFGRLHPSFRIGRADRVDASMRAPRPFGAPFDADASLFYRFEDQPAFLEERLGAGAGVSRQLLERDRCPHCPDIIAQLRYEASAGRLDLREEDEPEENDDPRAILSGPLANVGRIAPVLLFDRRDSFVDPRRGWTADARLELAHALLSPIPEGHNFWRALLGATAYLNLGAIWERPLGADRYLGGPLVLAISGGFGSARPLQRQPGLPDSEALYYGGDYSMRGLAPFASAVAFPGARYRLTSSLELRWYAARNILFGSFQLAAFVDAATVSYRADELWREPAVSVGPVLRYITPVGPISLGWGVAVVRPPSIVEARPGVIPERGRLSLTFGYSF